MPRQNQIHVDRAAPLSSNKTTPGGEGEGGREGGRDAYNSKVQRLVDSTRSSIAVKWKKLETVKIKAKELR